MRLFELTGTKGLKQKILPFGDHLAPSQDASWEPNTDTLDKYMKSKNWYRIGDGIYSVVYAKADKNYILKFSVKDPGYKKFLQYCKTHNNVNLPRIGKVFQINSDILVVQIEKLTPIDENINVNIRIISVLRYLKTDENFDLTDSNIKIDVNSIVNLLGIPENNIQNFFKTLVELRKLNDSNLDLHSGNIMKRGNIPVIIDPISDPFEQNISLKYLDRLNLH